MNHIVIGLNYKTTPIAIREQFNYNEDEQNDFYQKIKENKNILECMLLSTCNRVEIYAVVNSLENGKQQIIDILARKHQLDKLKLNHYVYFYDSDEAIKHLCKVVSGLDSLVLGENQIQGQVRKAYQKADDNQSIKKYLHRLIQSTMSLGKKVRHETAIGEGAMSIGSAAIDLIKSIYPRNSNLKVLMIGAGKTSHIALKSLKDYGNTEIVIANRNKDRAKQLLVDMSKASVKIEHYNNRYQLIDNVDIVLVSTSADDFVIQKKELKKKIENSPGKKRQHPLKLFVDLSVPRNIDPAIHDLDGMMLYCVDDLQNIVKNNLQKRKNQIRQGLDLIEKGTDSFQKWFLQTKIADIVKEKTSNGKMEEIAEKFLKSVYQIKDKQSLVNILEIFQKNK